MTMLGAGSLLLIGSLLACEVNLGGGDGDATDEASPKRKKKRKKKKPDDDGPSAHRDGDAFDFGDTSAYSFGGSFDLFDGMSSSFVAVDHSEFEPDTFSPGWVGRESWQILKRARNKDFTVKALRSPGGASCLIFHENRMVRRLMMGSRGPTEEFAYSKRGRLIFWYFSDRKKRGKQKWAYFHQGANMMRYDRKEGSDHRRASTPPGGTADHILENSWACLSAFGAANPKPGANTAPPPAPPPAPAPPAPATATKFAVGQAVLVLWGTEWWPGKILEAGPNSRYKVTYEGYDSSWDEVVPSARVRSR